MKCFGSVLAWTAGLSMIAAAAEPIRLVSSGQFPSVAGLGKPLTAGLTRWQTDGVTSGGFGQFDDTPVEASTQAAQHLDTIEGGILQADGTQLLCEVALVTPRFGFVAASCVSFIGEQVDPNHRLTVACVKGRTEFGGVLVVENVIRHPQYNPETFENNIAVVMLGSNPAINFENKIADWPGDWSNYYYVHRTVTTGILFSWNEPYVSVTNGTTDVTTNHASCRAASALYAANEDKFICNSGTVTFYDDRSCNLPYGAVYGGTGNEIAAAALYSHSAIHGDGGYCGTDMIINYYLMLREYIPWAETVSGLTIPRYHSQASSGYTATNDVNFSLDPPAGSNGDGVMIFGNFTTQVPVSEPSSEEDVEPEAESTPEPESDDTTPIEPVDIVETNTLVVTSMDIETEVTTVVTTSIGQSTEIITSTTTETISTTETETSTVMVTSAVTATATATPMTLHQPNPTNTVVITPEFYTLTETVTSTVTEHADNHQVSKDMDDTTLTVTVTESAISIVGPSIDGFTPIIITATVVSTETPDSTSVITETITETQAAQVITSFITISYGTTPPAVAVPQPTLDPVHVTSTVTETVSEAPEHEASSNKWTTILIIAGVLLSLLLIIGALFFYCRRKHKNGPAPTSRIMAWVHGNQPNDNQHYNDSLYAGAAGKNTSRRGSTYTVSPPPNYSISMDKH